MWWNNPRDSATGASACSNGLSASGAREPVVLTWWEVQSGRDPTLSSWLATYEESFPFEVRAPSEVIAEQIRRRDLGQAEDDVHHLAAALDGQTVVGGAMFSFLDRSRVGFISYVFVDSRMRGHGIGEWIFRRLLAVLEADSAALHLEPMAGVVFEVEREDLAKTPGEGMERIRRLRFFARLGAGILTGLDYLQPPLHAGEAPLPMYLMYQPMALSSQGLSAGDVLAWVAHIYDAIYVKGAGLSESVVRDCLDRVERSMEGGHVALRRPE
ncbi:MAG TPA: GNAT family N-acetyltransferase [Candidatus Methylomirabilis sp.]|nr:GNAT family N-acetyltransferase [Candidatus Methylomirabilis sp.]